MTWGKKVDVCQDPAHIDVHLRLNEMDEIKEEAHRIIRDDPPEGPAHRWFPHVLRRASENVARRRRWRKRKATT